MKLLLAGISHRTAPVALREQIAFSPAEIPAALSELQAGGASEAVILSTCNRVEITVAMPDEGGRDALIQTLARRYPLQDHLYVYEGEAAIRHLFRVACSLDSMIIGEPQILGQLKQAYAQAREQGAIGNLLETVLTRAFHVAKRVRTETEIGQSAVSVSYAAVELAREIFGSLTRKKVFIVGAGKMSESTARHLLRAGVSQILITNRTAERAQELANVFRGEAVPYELFPHRLGEVDIVIASSAAPGYILDAALLRRALESRKNQPMFLIDIAVPRNVDPKINELEHVFLYDIDDLSGIAARNRDARKEVSQHAELIVAEEVERLQTRLRERDIAPTIQSFQAQLESIRKDVLERYRPKMGALTPEQEQALDAITRAILNKVAHGPISELRRHAAGASAGDDPHDGQLVSVVRRMFRIRES